MPGMKPAFALSLDQNGITLLHRTSQGFSVVGTADPEAADLGDRLGMLRATALGLAPQGLTTKIIVPESQILYIDAPAPGPDRGTRRAQIARALEGRTPYPVSDLVYDWSGTGAVVQVAVVARVTLDEAEAFAENYRFAPVSFVAVPPEGRFGGEPYFGTTARAGDHLPAGERLDRDQDPVRLLAASITAGAIAEVADVPPQDDTASADAPEDVAADTVEDEAPFVIVVGDDPDISGEVGRALAPPDDAEAGPDAVSGAVAAVAGALDVDSMPPEPDADAPAGDVIGTIMDEAPADAAGLAAGEMPDDRPETGTPDESGLSTEPPTAAPEQTPDPAIPDDDAAIAADAPETATAEPVPDESTEAPSEPSPAVAASAPVIAADTTADSIPEPADQIADEPAAAAADPAAAADLPAEASEDAAPPAFFTRRQRREAARAAADPAADDATASSANASFANEGAPIVAPVIPQDATSAHASGAAAPLSVAAAQMPGDPDDTVSQNPPVGSAATGARSPMFARPPEPIPDRFTDRPIIAERSAPRTAEPARRTPGPTILSRLMARLPSSAAATRDATRPVRAATAVRTGGAVPGSGRGASAVPGRLYMGAALTLALLIFMAAAALWATWSDSGTPQVASAGDAAPTADRDAAADPAGTDTIAAPDAVAVGDLTPPEADETAAAVPDQVVSADPGPADPASAAVADPPADAEPVAAPPDEATNAPAPPGRILPVPDTLRDYATEGLLNAAPAAAVLPEPDAAGAPAPGPVDPDPVFGADASLPGADALASDLAPGTIAVPVPYNQALRYDAEGMIEATPEGVAAPGGFTLIAGKPARLPPDRPADLVPATAVIVPGTQPSDPALGPNPLAGKRPLARPAGITPEDSTALQPGAAVPVAPASPVANPALAALQPRARPAGSSAAAAAVPAEGSAPQAGPLSPPVDARHAALAPRARSDAAVAAAADRQSTADAVAAAAAAALSAETAAASAPGVGTASRYAVASSRRPSSKPPRFAQSVEAALAVAVAEPVAQAEPAPEPVAEPEVQAAAEPAPAELDEPEPQNAAPDIPTRASVAKQATIRNALDLGDVSLIGVYGSSSNRRALVRMSSGRFVKVEVGDRLDGGKVAAIGDTQLTYVKNGRSIVLKMIRDS